jgi:putative redox protein
MADRSERFEFPGGRGDRLSGRLDYPAGAPAAVALFAHCFTCSKDIRAASRIAEALNRQGIAVLRFDFTGLGHSEGEFANTNFSSNIADLVAAADALRERALAPAILVGHSLGGAAVLAAAHRVPECRAVATIGAPFDPAHVARHLRETIAAIQASGEAEVTIGGRPFRLRRQFLEDIAAHNLKDAIADLRRALLVFHSPVDAVVGIESASAIFQAARHPKSFVSLDRADHLLSDEADALYVGTVLGAWASRYIGAPEAARPEAAGHGAGEPITVTVAEAAPGPYSQVIDAGGHALRADEPAEAGGRDTGPSPYELLLSALGACTSMTIRMYAERKQWPLARVEVRLSHRKIHAEECRTCETKEGRIDRIERVISLEGPLDAAQKARLLEIADRCPVHRTLTSEVLIETRPGEEGAP